MWTHRAPVRLAAPLAGVRVRLAIDGDHLAPGGVAGVLGAHVQYGLRAHTGNSPLRSCRA
eukprot:4505952-Pyramimonas_sp.AAC.1